MNDSRERITIVLDVTGDRLTEDPCEVADELLDDAINKAGRCIEARKVNIIGAEWTP